MPQRHDRSTPLNEIKADLFKALGHPVRVRVLELLSQEPTTVGALLTSIGVEASHLSQHLAVLRRAGLVTKERQGNTVTYALTAPAVAEMLAAARTFLLHHLGQTSHALSDLAEETQDGR